jgi:hypothetical protein
MLLGTYLKSKPKSYGDAPTSQHCIRGSYEVRNHMRKTSRVSDWLPVLDDADIERAAGRAVCGYGSAARVTGNEVHVDDGHARRGGEALLAAFTGSGSAHRPRPCHTRPGHRADDPRLARVRARAGKYVTVKEIA